MRIGVDLGGTNLRVGIVDENGEVSRRETVPTRAGEPPDEVLRDMISMIETMGEPSSVGVGAPGLISHKDGVVRTSPNLPQWNNFPLGARLKEHFGVPVHVANDVNAVAWGEFLFGAGQDCTDIFCITLGTGLGGGVICDGKLYTGKDDTAGEIGHFPFVRDGEPCPCGNRGCLEQYVAKHGIKRKADRLSGDGEVHNPETIAREAASGKDWAVQVYREVASDLAMVLAGFIQVFNFEKIIVGGQISKAGEVLFGPLRSEMDRHLYNFLHDKYEIVPAELGEDSGIIGSAWLDKSGQEAG